MWCASNTGRRGTVISAISLRRRWFPRGGDRLAMSSLNYGMRSGMTARLIESASRLPDRALRSLHAVHLATALALRDSLHSVVTYDKRLATAVDGYGIPVDSPGGAAGR